MAPEVLGPRLFVDAPSLPIFIHGDDFDPTSSTHADFRSFYPSSINAWATFGVEALKWVVNEDRTTLTTNPDAVLHRHFPNQKPEALFVWQSEKPAVLSHLQGRSLIQSYLDCDTKTVSIVNQLSSYMHEYEVTYVSLANWEETWIFRRSGALGITSRSPRSLSATPPQLLPAHPSVARSSSPGRSPSASRTSLLLPALPKSLSPKDLTRAHQHAALSSTPPGSGDDTTGGPADEAKETGDSWFEGPPKQLKSIDTTSFEASKVVVGSGSMGVSYCGVFEGRPAILKMLGLGKTKRGQERLTNEIEAYEALWGLAVGVFIGGGEWGPLGVLATEEIVNGRKEGVKTMEGFEEDLLLIEDSLRFNHESGYVHGDVRPQNILFSGEGADRKALFIDLETAHKAGEEELENPAIFTPGESQAAIPYEDATRRTASISVACAILTARAADVGATDEEETAEAGDEEDAGVEEAAVRAGDAACPGSVTGIPASTFATQF
ncbi:hypothetical protein BDK51DRAFT_46893 [Blyttiomyces helicus]|uniref:Uncharacterized protein n=1 Tax=Blyttiomyces helicus TaxID=388810 RepID=A0A4P9WH85_9FUNG|nr:hypothetical protein BDK51DRAFT_46893 [Blyttiomyces helicus]|eukprot:RKO89886.1 hypothetical protein BDK51DRAFT_46893 [Blyttiomyces helicus]